VPETPDVRIVVVFTEDRNVVAVGRVSGKAVRKSVEHGELWWLHPGTDRVLPFEGHELVSLESGKPWVEAVVRPKGPAADQAPSSPEAVEAPKVRHEASSERSELSDGSILVELADVIHQRRVERPEGSYTSYLFEEGPGKIRKKTGEEAVEVILASSRDELVHEGADLIYHLLVLYEAEGIPVSALLDELASRRR